MDHWLSAHTALARECSLVPVTLNSRGCSDLFWPPQALAFPCTYPQHKLMHNFLIFKRGLLSHALYILGFFRTNKSKISGCPYLSTLTAYRILLPAGFPRAKNYTCPILLKRIRLIFLTVDSQQHWLWPSVCLQSF